jgi:hypothetical protein
VLLSQIVEFEFVIPLPEPPIGPSKRDHVNPSLFESIECSLNVKEKKALPPFLQIVSLPCSELPKEKKGKIRGHTCALHKKWKLADKDWD